MEEEIALAFHARIREFSSGSGTDRKNNSDNVFFSFSPQLIYSFKEGVRQLILRKTMISLSFQRGPTFSTGGGGPSFSRGGVQILISIETYRTCDFQWGRGPDPLFPLWVRAWFPTYQTVVGWFQNKISVISDSI